MNWTIASLLLLFAAVAAYLWMRWITAPPLDEPAAVASPFKFERTIAVHVSDRYFLELRFDRRDASFEALRSLVGGVHGQKVEKDGRLVDVGEPAGLLVPVLWSVRDADSRMVIASGSSDVLGSNSWSAAEVGRLLYQGDIEAGRYTFAAELVSGLPEFRDIRARLLLSLSPPHTQSRIMGMYWLSALFVPLALLGFVVTAAIAAWKSWT
jgi:hypothetical protein